MFLSHASIHACKQDRYNTRDHFSNEYIPLHYYPIYWDLFHIFGPIAAHRKYVRSQRCKPLGKLDFFFRIRNLRKTLTEAP